MTPSSTAPIRVPSAHAPTDSVSVGLFVGLLRLHLTRLSLYFGIGLVAVVITLAPLVDGQLLVIGTPLLLAGLLVPAGPTLFERSTRVPPHVLLMARLCARALEVVPTLGIGLALLHVGGLVRVSLERLVPVACFAVIAVTVPFVVRAAHVSPGDRPTGLPSVYVPSLTLLAGAPVGLMFLPTWVHVPLLASLAVVSVVTAFVVWPRAFAPVHSADSVPRPIPVSALDTGYVPYGPTLHDRWPTYAQLVCTLRIVMGRLNWWSWTFYPLAIVGAYWVGWSYYLLHTGTMLTSQLLVRETRFLSLLAISPARRLAGILLMGPAALLLLSGMGVGARAVYEHVTTPPVQRDMGRAPWVDAPFHDAYVKGFRDPSRVSIAFWHLAPRGGVPDIVAPWGERVRPYTMAAFGRTLYNPFSVRPTSSGRFYGWQWQRLLRTVYGAPVVRTLDEPFPWPPAVTEHWTVRLVLGALALSGLLAVTACAWSARRGSLVIQLASQAVILLPLLYQPLLKWFAPEARPGFVSQWLQGRILDALAWFPNGSMRAMMAVGAACLFMLLVSVLLWRTSRPVAFEFEEFRRS